MEDREFKDDFDEDNIREGGCGALDQQLYSMLKDLRKSFAKKHKLPPYVIFQDVSLEQMATMYPVTIQELQNVQGVGAGKAKRFGKEFCELIRKYCEDNEIERPEELRVRTVAKKSMLKVFIIQSIDRQIALDDIAEAKGLDFDTITVKEKHANKPRTMNIDTALNTFKFIVGYFDSDLKDNG